MNDITVILWMCSNKDEAKKILKVLFEKKAIACVNIFPHVESMFFWEGRIQTEKECCILIKTRKNNFEKVKQIIENLSSYDVPEILKVAVEDGFKPYLSWVCSVTQD